MRKRTLVFVIISACAAAAVVVFLFWRQLRVAEKANLELRDELRAEVDVWLAALPPIPPDSENGALLVLKGIDSISYAKELSDIELAAGSICIQNETDAGVVRKVLAEYDEALRLVSEGLRRDKCVFPIDCSKGLEAELPDMVDEIGAAKVLAFKGQLAVFEGRVRDALGDFLDILRFGTMMRSVRNLVGRLLETAVCGMGIGPLITVLADESLDLEDMEWSLRELLCLYEKRGDFAAVYMDDYYLCFALTIVNLLDGKTPGGDIDEEAAQALRNQPFYDWRSEVNAYKEFLGIVGDADPAKYYSYPEESVQERVEEFYAKATFNPAKSSRILITIMLPRTSGSLVREFAAKEVQWRGAIVLAAIRLFEKKNSRLPKNLGELGDLVPKKLLTDPFSGKHLVYEAGEGTFRLRSVGPDKVDSTDDDLVFHTDKKK